MNEIDELKRAWNELLDEIAIIINSNRFLVWLGGVMNGKKK